MDETKFQFFIKAQAEGRKAEAKTAVRTFVASCAADTEADIERWVFAYLATLTDHPHLRVRHELLEDLILPVLLRGYGRQDPDSLCWLGRLWANLQSDRRLFAKIENKTMHNVSGLQLLRRAYHLAPDRTDIAQALFKALVDVFDDVQHEWPTGLLMRRDEVPEYLVDIRLARQLDSSGRHQLMLDQFEDRLRRCRLWGQPGRPTD